jgi:hypothetical protein
MEDGAANVLKNVAKGQSIDALKNLWERYKYAPIESIVLPETEDKPVIPML